MRTPTPPERSPGPHAARVHESVEPPLVQPNVASTIASIADGTARPASSPTAGPASRADTSSEVNRAVGPNALVGDGHGDTAHVSVGQAPNVRDGASVDILGVRVDDVTYPEALAILVQAIESRVPHVVTTPNPEFVMLARNHPPFRACLNRAAMNIPDGIGLVLAARLTRQRLREHVQGTDLVLMLAAESVRADYRWFLLGGEGNVAARAAVALREQFPGLQIVGAEPGSPLAQDDAEVHQRIAAVGPVDVLLVAYGAPKQELWLDRNLAALGIPVGIGVGGVFNYFSGATPRAPHWVRRIHFEWLHRLVTQPWRWRRQLALPAFALLALMAALRVRLAAPRARPAAR